MVETAVASEEPGLRSLQGVARAFAAVLAGWAALMLVFHIPLGEVLVPALLGLAAVGLAVRVLLGDGVIRKGFAVAALVLGAYALIVQVIGA